MALDPIRCSELRLSYARQILAFVEVNNPYGHLMRTLLDGWYAAKRGWPFMMRPGHGGEGYSPIHLNAPKPNQHRQALLLLRHSRAAHDIMHHRATGDLVKDHAVPIRAIRQWVCEANLSKPEDVDTFLAKWYRVALITKEEHRCLDKVNLRSAMPNNWNSSDPWARYAEIDMLPDPDDAPIAAQHA
nr:hypothetical protein [uncultured Sphingomonas sp.]